jgi:inorganic pyrophosphatase
MEKIKDKIIKNLKQDIAKARKEVNTNPSEAQIKANNYKKGHINIMGFNITIENPKNSYREGVDANGKKWKTKMCHDYGYFRQTLGKDGDAIDVFIGDNLHSKKIFVVDQFLNGEFDESKVMLGFNDEKQAKDGYLSNYEKDWKGFKKITEVSIDVFKDWLYDGYKQRKAFYQYVDIQKKKLNENVEYKFTINEIKNRKNDNGEVVPQKCDKCGSKIDLVLRGEPIYVCSNKECNKYFGTLPFSKK